MEKSIHIPSYQKDLQKLITDLSEALPQDALSVFNQDAAQLEERYTSPLKLSKGDQAPLFSLPNAMGKIVHLTELLKQGKVVLTFYRGSWCPYCNLALNSYQKILPQMKALGASLVAVSPQRPDESLNMKEKNNLAFEVLSDTGNQIAKQYTTVFKNGEAPIAAMEELGIDFHAFYESKDRELPIPALFIIRQDGTIEFARAESGDYRQRVEPSEILDNLQ
ncbi:MAG: peroxiredoxin-like family protein [Bacteroidota bacterium]